MRKQVPVVEWLIAENDADWTAVCPAQPAITPDANRHLYLQRYYWSVAALRLLLVGAADWWWRTAQPHPSQP